MLDNLPDAGPFLSVNSVKTEIFRRGQGRPLLFLHPELGLSAAAPVLDALGGHFAVTAPSLPGYGHTEFPRAWSSVDDLAYHTLDLLEALNLRDAILVGVSLGGWLAAEIATKSCERLAGVVLVNPAGIKTGDREHRDMLDIFSLPQKELEAKTFADPSHAKFDPAAASDDEVYVRMRNRETTVLLGWSPYMYNPKLAGRLHRIRVPSLVLWGSEDRIAPESYGRTYAQRIPGAKFQTIAKAGRFPHIEQPQEFARAVAAFAKDAPPRP
jgi:pimeloyl-ACP methyl ester carboxylesterase